MVTGKIDQAFDCLRINLRLLEVFIATAHDGSTRAAAGRVSRPQSAASSAMVSRPNAIALLPRFR